MDQGLSYWLALFCLYIDIQVSVYYWIPFFPKIISNALQILTSKESYLFVVLVLCGEGSKYWIFLFVHLSYTMR